MLVCAVERFIPELEFWNTLPPSPPAQTVFVAGKGLRQRRGTGAVCDVLAGAVLLRNYCTAAPPTATLRDARVYNDGLALSGHSSFGDLPFLTSIPYVYSHPPSFE